MRFILAALILTIAIPEAEAAGTKAVCKNHCDSNYGMCVNRATTKNARKSCKTDRKLCKSGCR